MSSVSTATIGPAPRGNPRPWYSRVGHVLAHEFRLVLPPTIFFAIGFNLIVLSTNLILAQYLEHFASFLLATTAALVVGKAVLVADKMPFLRRFDRAPLIQPILFKTAIYVVFVFLARLIEATAHFGIEHGTVLGTIPFLLAHFSWHRFAFVQLWITVLFLLYVTAAELNALFGPGEMRRLFFTHRPRQLQLTRRERIRVLGRLSRLADRHSATELADAHSPAHRELVAMLQSLARREAVTGR
ncbi:MAG TPA: hypothetical protein VME92_03045 [Acetobacteraceae bacterium]|nr:hypothetical protein [Acetobacteraceae bacterium]